MLSPDARAVAFELIRAPDGYRLDFAVLTTYTLDLEALLVLPLSILAHQDESMEELLADPVRLHQALRDAGDRVHVFVDQTGIGVPRAARALYAMLESSVHGVRAPGRGSFHAKVWVARFTAIDDAQQDQPPLLRVAVLSRNLTFDRSWDIALASEASPRGESREAATGPLGDFLDALPRLTGEPLEERVAARVRALAEDTGRTQFPAPAGFTSPIDFHALGLSSPRSWRPTTRGYRTLAIAPFVNLTGLKAIVDLGGSERVLVSRGEELDRLPEDALAGWSEVLVLSDAAQDEPEDGHAGECEPMSRNGGVPSGLHAKIVAVEHGWDVTWYIGSANLTAAAFGGSNVEMMASVTGRKGRRGGVSGHGIDRFLDGAAGFRKLCVPYRRGEVEPEAAEAVSARLRLEEARDHLAQADLHLLCSPAGEAGEAGEAWSLNLHGRLALPDDIEITAWPISVAEDDARRLDLPLSWSLPVALLTAFIAFRLTVRVRGVDDIRFALRLPVEGMPEDRLHHVLRSLLDSPEKFLRFLRALLGGLDGMVGWTRSDGDGSAAWGAGLSVDTLLDDLLRAASRDPNRLQPVRRLIDDLRKTEDGRRIIPDDLLAVWTAVNEALGTDAAS